MRLFGYLNHNVYICIGYKKKGRCLNVKLNFSMCSMRISTIVRNNAVHSMYKEIMDSLGELRNVVFKTYVYDLIHAKTKLSVRTISHILNHTKEEDVSSL